MVTLVRPSSMFFKCLNVMARPVTIAGRYNRSRQFSFGRGTVTAAMSFLSGSQAARIKDFSILPGFLVSRFIALECKEELLLQERYSRVRSRKRRANQGA